MWFRICSVLLLVLPSIVMSILFSTTSTILLSTASTVTSSYIASSGICVSSSPQEGGTLMLQVSLQSTSEALSHLPSLNGVEGKTIEGVYHCPLSSSAALPL